MVMGGNRETSKEASAIIQTREGGDSRQSSVRYTPHAVFMIEMRDGLDVFQGPFHPDNSCFS